MRCPIVIVKKAGEMRYDLENAIEENPNISMAKAKKIYNKEEDSYLGTGVGPAAIGGGLVGLLASIAAIRKDPSRGVGTAIRRGGIGALMGVGAKTLQDVNRLKNKALPGRNEENAEKAIMASKDWYKKNPA